MNHSKTVSTPQTSSPRLGARVACCLLLLAALLLPSVETRAANTVLTVTAANLLDSGSWSPGPAVPTAANDAVFDVNFWNSTFYLGFDTGYGNLTVGSINFLNTSGASLQDFTGDVGSEQDSVLVLAGGTGNSVPGANVSDLLYITNGVNVYIHGENGLGWPSLLQINLATNGNFDIASGASAIISANITGTGFGLNRTGGASGALTVTGNLSFTGGLTNTAGFYTNNSLSTYAGPTVIKGGTNAYFSIASVGAGASALGAPTTIDNGVIHFLGGTLYYNGSANCTSDRIINWSGGGSFYNNSLTGKLLLTGGITNSGAWPASFRGSGTNVLTGLVSINTNAITRTDGGLLIITGQLNQFTGTPGISDGYFFIDTIANSNALCSLGSGMQINLGQGTATTGRLQLGVTNGSSCNRNLLINGGTAAVGGLIENTLAGTTVTFSGNVSSVSTNSITNSAPLLTLTGVGNGVLSGVIGATANAVAGLAITKAGTGTWTLSGANTNRGTVTVSAGTLLINGMSAGATNSLTVASGATLGGNGTNGGPVILNGGGILAPGGLNTVGKLTLTNNLTLNGNTLFFDLGNVAGTGDQVVVGNALNVNGANNIVLSFPNGTAPAGTYTVITNIVAKTGSGTFALQGSYPNVTLNVTATSVQVVVAAGGAYANNLTWKGNVSAAWDTITGNWATNGVGGALYADGNNVFFDDSLTANPVVSGGTVSPSTVSFNNNTAVYTIAAAIGGAGTTLTKGGTAVTALTGANTYTSNTLANAGTLVVSNGGAINSPFATLNVGSGSTRGTVTLADGGSITVRQLLATNLAINGISNSFFNFSGGTLTTSNNNGLAAAILVPTNTTVYAIKSSWNMNGGTNYIACANTNPVISGYSITIGYQTNNVAVTVNSNAVFTTQNPWGTVTNMQMVLGNGVGTFGNRLIITNGGRAVFRRGASSGDVALAIANSAGTSSNGVIVAGTNGSGGKATFDCGVGNNRINLGANTSTTNNWVLVGDGGVITNVSLFIYGSTNSLTITNGGQVYTAGAVIARAPAYGSYVMVGGADSAGNKATLFSSGDVTLGGNAGAAGPANGNWIWVDQNGLITNTTTGKIGIGMDTNAFGNYLVITNGGQVFSKTASVIGNWPNANNNFVTIGGSFGTTNSLWNLNATSLTIGNNAAATNNFVTLSTGGVLTNVSSIILGGVNSALIFNGGKVSANASSALIVTNATTLFATNWVQAGGAIIDTANFTVPTVLPLIEDSSSTGGGLTKQGTGTLVLNGVNTYTGPTLVSAGRLTGVSGGASAGSAVTVVAGAINSVQLLTPGGQWTCAALTNFDGSTLDFNLSAGTLSATAPLSVTGAFALTNANITVRTIPAITVGQFPLVKYGTFTGSLTPATLSLPPGVVATLSNNVANTSIDLVVTTGYTPQFAIYWAVGNGNWDFATMNWKDTPAAGVTNLIYTNNAPVVLDDSTPVAGTILVTNSAPVSPSKLLVDVTVNNYTISGAAITGSATLTKTNVGTLTFNGTNTYTGDTLVNGGTLAVSGGGAIYTPANKVNIGFGSTVATNTLAAGGAVTVQTILATNVNLNGLNNSIFNFAGGTLTTSNNNGIAASIVTASNAAFNIHGSWNMNAGTNMVATVATNLVTPTVNFGSADNNLVFNVNSNAVLALANPALNSTNMTLLIGNGNATNNVFTVNGGQVTNLSLFYVGFGATAVSNQLNVINGGRISFTTNANGFNQMQGSYNSLIVAGANVAGQRATIDLGFGIATTDRRIYVGNGTGQNGNLLRVDAGGVVTNAGIQSASGAGNGVVVTNGGRAYFTGGVGLGRNGGNTNYVIVGGFDAAGNNSLLYCSAGLDIGGSGNGGTPGAGTNNWVLVDRGGILTMASIRVGAGGSDYNSFSNRLIIANGGQVFTTNACSVGTLTNGVNNWVSVGGSFGTTNSSWNLNFQALTIGASITNYISTNNYVLLSAGGILTNVSSVILGGVNSSLTFNGGTLAAGTNATLIATNVTTVGATNYVQAGGAFIDSVNFTVTNLVPLTEDPSSTGGGLTKLGVGTLFLNGVNTYTGNTLVGAGMLAGVSGGSASSAVTVLTGATNSVITVGVNGQWTCPSLANNNGSTLDINFGLAPSATAAPLNVTGLFALTNANVSVRSAVPLLVGQYPLVKYGSVSGTPASATVSLPAGVTGYLSNNTANTSIDLVVTTGFNGLFWKGYVNGVWDDAVNANWLGGAPTIYTLGAAVVFDDSLTGNTNVSSGATVSPASVLMANNLTNYVLAASIGGSGALTKNGSAMLSLSGSNSFSGGVTLNAGTLAVSSTNALGTGTFTINGGILDNKSGVLINNTNNNAQIWNNNITFAGSAALNLGTGAVTMNTNLTVTGSASALTVGGNISGTGGLTSLGAGALTLSGNASFTGGVTHSGAGPLLLSGNMSFTGGVTNTAGTLTNSGLNTYPGGTLLAGGTLYYNSLANVGSPSALGQPANAADGVIMITNGSNLRYIGTNDSTSDRVFNYISGTFYNDSTTGKLILTGGFTNSNNSYLTFRGVGTNVVTGPIIIGNGGVSRTDGGLVIFTNQAYQYTGNVTIQDGYFYIDTIANSNAPSSIGAGALITLGQLNGGTVGKLQLAVTNGSSCDRAILISSQNAASGGLIENTIAGRTVTFSGPITSQITNASAGPTLTLTGVGNGVLSGVLGINTNPAVAMNLAKTGAGTWTISGFNTNRGTVTVSAGTLLINGDSSGATNTVTVNGGAFGGNGTNGGSVVLNAGGILVPGGAATLGKLTLTNSLTLNGGPLSMDLGNVAGACDLVAVGGALNLNGANTILLNFPNGLAPQGIYTLITMGSMTGSGTLALSGTTTNANLIFNANSIQLQVGVGGTYVNNYTWNGNVNGTWDTSTANWVNNGVAGAVYANGLDVTFDDTLTGTPTVSSSGTVLPNSVTFNNSGTSYTIAATIGGTNALTKGGTATTTLTGPNSYSGNTVVNAGALAVANGGVIYSPSATLNIGPISTVATNTLAAGGAITVQSLLATNVNVSGANNSILNFTGGTLTTSNNNGIAANILLAANTGLNINSSWNLNGGTNIISNVATNTGAGATLSMGNAANNVQVNVNANALLWLAVPTNSASTNTMALVVGNNNATNNVLAVNGGTLIVTNPYGQTINISVGSGVGASGNQLLVTNGGQVFTRGLGTTGPQAVSVGAGGNNVNNSLLVAGTNATGRKALLDCGNDRLQAGAGAGTGNSIRVDQGGVITNANFLGFGLSSSLTITNGGEMFATGMTVGRNGSNVSVVISGADAGGNKATLSFIGIGTNPIQNLTIGGGSPSGGNPGSNNWVRVDAGGLITNANTIYVGGNNLAADFNNWVNSLIITNGGQVYGTNGGVIGNSTNNNGNWISLGGGAGQSLWNLGNTSLTIGNQAVSTNNYATLFAGGILTNVSSVVLSGVNSALNFNGGALAAGANGNLIATSVTAVNATNYVQAGGAIIDTVTFSVTNVLPLVEDPGSTGGGLTKAGTGTLVLNAANTYSGATVVSAGTLLADNVSGSATGTGTVTVNSGATLGGTGTIAGQVHLLTGAFATNTVTLPLTNGGAMTLNGNTMEVGSLSALGAGDYLLITNTAGGITGSFASAVTVGGAGVTSPLSATIVTTGNAVTLHVASGPSYPATGTNITFTPISGNTFTLSWPANYTGWQLWSNAVDVTQPSEWFLVPGSTAVNSLTITINPSLTNVFYRMQHP